MVSLIRLCMGDYIDLITLCDMQTPSLYTECYSLSIITLLPGTIAPYLLLSFSPLIQTSWKPLHFCPICNPAAWHGRKVCAFTPRSQYSHWTALHCYIKNNLKGEHWKKRIFMEINQNNCTVKKSASWVLICKLNHRITEYSELKRPTSIIASNS